MPKKYLLSLSVFLLVGVCLSLIQQMPEKPMLLLERLRPGAGWVEVFLLSLYGGFLTIKMQDPKQSQKWRLRSWTIFSAFFFLQLLAGLFVSDIFLLTGKLHIPVPAMLIAGPIYRGELSIMTLLFLSTLVLSGSAWCSQLCYFGAIDGWAAQKSKAKAKPLLNRLMRLKTVFLFIVIAVALALRWFGTTTKFATLLGIGFGLVGLVILLLYSPRKGKMVHCIAYCPVGTVVNYLKFVSPFRLEIDKNTCTLCMQCTPICRYDALKLTDIQNKKPAITCTLCGDCLASCKDNSIRYRFVNATPKQAKNLYLFITIFLHALFLAMGRI